MLSGMRLKPRLITAFLIIGLLPFAIIGMVSLMQAKGALEKQAFSQLEAVRGIKKAQIDRYFAERAGDMAVLVDVVSQLNVDSATVEATFGKFFTDYTNLRGGRLTLGIPKLTKV